MHIIFMKKTPRIIKDIMTKHVISIAPDASLLEAFERILKGGFNGLPVVDKGKKLLGIVTEYDFLSKGSGIHLPTFIKLFGKYPDENRDRNLLIKESLADLLSFRVRDIMNSDPLALRENATIEEAVRMFGAHHRVNPIPVLDLKGKIVGVLSRFDVIRFYAKMLKEADKIGR